MHRKSGEPIIGLREHRSHPGTDPGAEGAGYGTSTGACPAGRGRNGVPVMWKEGFAVGQVLWRVWTEILGG